MHALLVECGVPFKTVEISLKKGDNRKPEFLKVNPRGQVPALACTDGTVITEGGAIIMYLCEKHPNKLMPQVGQGRTRAIQWLMFANSSMHPICATNFFLMRTADNSPGCEAVKQANVQRMNDAWKYVDQQLRKTRFVAGDEPSIADLLLTTIAAWNAGFPTPARIGSYCERMFAEVRQMPCFIRAMEAEGLASKKAA